MTERILLHILCMLLDHEWRWHWAGIRRDLSTKGGANPEATLLNGEKRSRKRSQNLSFNTDSNSGACRRSPDFVPLARGRARPVADALDDHRPLELGEYAEHLKHAPARGRPGVDRLPVQVQVATGGLQLAQRVRQVLKAPSEPIHRPDGGRVVAGL